MDNSKKSFLLSSKPLTPLGTNCESCVSACLENYLKKRSRQGAADLAASLFTRLQQEAASTCFKICLEHHWHSPAVL